MVEVGQVVDTPVDGIQNGPAVVGHMVEVTVVDGNQVDGPVVEVVC